MRSQIFPVFIFFLLLSTKPAVQAQPPGMYVDGRYLHSANGDTVILKGFNAMIVYWDIHGDKNFPEIEKTGANCVRIFWNLASPRPLPSDLDKVLENCLAHHMIPIISLWDATGDWSKIQYCVDYWSSAEIAPILQKYESQLILNIANEPGNKAMADSVFRNTYTSAVNQIRTAGLHMPLIIDSDNWGRHADAVLDNGAYLLEEDPDHNLIFSWHLWDPYNWATGTESEITRIINKAVQKDICFIVGEFGPCEQCDNCTGKRINWEFMIEKAYKNDIGYIPWVWKWSDCHSVVNNTSGAYGSWVNSPWGENVAILSEYSIQKTARKPASLQTGIMDQQDGIPIFSTSPNPFTGEVTFSFNLDKASKVKIVIRDISGRTIKTIADLSNHAGELNIHWNSYGVEGILQRGIYLCTVNIENSSGSITETDRIIKL